MKLAVLVAVGLFGCATAPRNVAPDRAPDHATPPAASKACVGDAGTSVVAADIDGDGTLDVSAGVSAGVDLALALVEQDRGREVAMEVARQLVVCLRRPGGQSQFSQLLQLQSTETTSFERLHRWLERNLARADLNRARRTRPARAPGDLAGPGAEQA